MLGFVSEYTHSKNDGEEKMDYMVGIKSTPRKVLLTPSHLVIRPNLVKGDDI